MTENAHNLIAHDAEHERVWSSLPWFVNGTLSVGERQAADSHLSMCLVCRREAIALGALREAIASRTLEPRCESALKHLHQRIDAPVYARTAFPWAAAAVLAIVVGLASVSSIKTGLISIGGQSDTYVTLGSRTIEVNDGAVATARIVFKQFVTERQLRDLLLAVDAELVDGPTPRGAYTIALPQVSDGEELQAVVASLRQSKRVIFVEPIIIPGSQRTND
ncbi:MAG: hypothetical protein E2O35_02780 [Proteobacteria bacterium]|nr:MAG: hypothetical protein E2O35_02780 [Pseudomonadota bacterium]